MEVTKVLRLLSLAVVLTGCGNVQTKAQSEPVAVVGPRDCKTEPNGSKIWYPELTGPSYREGARIQFEGWPSVCKNGKWETDTALQKVFDAADKEQSDLILAAQTRVLTAYELQALQSRGPGLFVRYNQAFFQDDIERQFNNLVIRQLLIRTAAKKKRVTWK